MAAPLDVTTKAMSGKFLMNKGLSDSTEDILLLQGVSWMTRRAIAMSSITLIIKHITDEGGVERISTVQTITGGLSTSMNRTLDWQERDENDTLYGAVTTKARRISVEEITDEYLKQGWTQDTIENDIVLNETWSTRGKNENAWRAAQGWGFAMVNGERRYVRLTSFTSDKGQGALIQARLVYDYLGSA